MHLLCNMFFVMLSEVMAAAIGMLWTLDCQDQKDRHSSRALLLGLL
jgi:hypothetical protein